jgi:putative tryptophan/tyrosine transport system substrate-binding protein
MTVGMAALAAVVLLGLVGPTKAEAQSSSKSLPRIGFLSLTTSPIGELEPAARRLHEAFEAGLRAHGYVDGQNILIERRHASGQPDRLTSLALELLRLRVDVIVAPTTPAALAAQKATKTIPIVMVTAGDPIGTGLVESLRRPGGNVTGTTIMGTDLAAKRLDLITELLPGVSRVALLWPPSHRTPAPVWKLALMETHAAAKARGVTLVPLPVESFQDFTSASAVIAKEVPEALIVLPDPLSFLHRAQIVSFAARHRLPGIFPEREYVEAGGLMAYGADLASLYRRAGAYVDKILRGTKPPDLPVEQPTEFELIINRKTANTLAIAVPQAVLLRADAIID